MIPRYPPNDVEHHPLAPKSAFNIRVVSGRVASPGEVLVVVLVVLVVAF